MNNVARATSPKFELGRVVGTLGGLRAVQEAGQTPAEFLKRHAAGDWGDALCHEDGKLNDESLTDGSRLLSAYNLRTGVKIWLITEATDDQGRRAATTLLLPEEY